MNYPSYPAYRKTDVPWLGDIPKHWEIRKLKFELTLKNSNVDKHIKDGEEPVRLCNYVDVYYNDYITENLDFMQATATKEEIERFGLREGDVLLTKDSESWDDIAVPAYVRTKSDDLVCGYHLAMMRPASDDFDGGFLFQLLRSEAMNYQFKIAANGVTRFGLPKFALDNALVVKPPIEEQKAINDFIESETARIDVLIEKKRRLLELLEEKRLAVITQAVTKGLDPDVPMKDSKIEWLGDIPESWEAIPLRRLLSIDTKNGLYKPKEKFHPSGVPFVQMGEAFSEPVMQKTAKDRVIVTKDELESWGLKSGDLLFARRSLVFEGSGKCSLIGVLEEEHVFESSMIRVRLDPKKINNNFAYKYFSSTFSKAKILATTKRVTISGIDSQQLKSIYVLVPPLEEQEAIVEYLSVVEHELSDTEEMIRKAMQQIEEYRTALITNAVTGKIDVREIVKEGQAA